MRITVDDISCRSLNPFELRALMPIRRHRNTSETMVMVREKLIERLYDDVGNMTDEYIMEPCGVYLMVQIELAVVFASIV